MPLLTKDLVHAITTESVPSLSLSTQFCPVPTPLLPLTILPTSSADLPALVGGRRAGLPTCVAVVHYCRKALYSAFAAVSASGMLVPPVLKPIGLGC